MSDTLILSVPERLFAGFVVAGPDRLPEGVRELGARLTDETIVDLCPFVDILGPEDGPIPWLAEVYGCAECGDRVDPDLARRVADGERHLGVACAYGPAWPPLHLWLAAFTAQMHEQAGGGVVVDAETSWPLQEDWAWADVPDGFAIAEWVKIAVTSTDRGMQMATMGMARLGLPEIQAERIPSTLLGPWANLTNGVAQRLLLDQWRDLADHPGRALREIDARVTISVADIEAATDRDRDCPDGTAVVQLRHDPATSGQSYLTITRPDEHPATDARWRQEVVEQLNLVPRGGPPHPR